MKLGWSATFPPSGLQAWAFRGTCRKVAALVALLHSIQHEVRPLSRSARTFFRPLIQDAAQMVQLRLRWSAQFPHCTSTWCSSSRLEAAELGKVSTRSRHTVGSGCETLGRHWAVGHWVRLALGSGLRYHQRLGLAREMRHTASHLRPTCMTRPAGRM